ncbi:MAG: serine/threonine protein kinase [Anaerolineae bacterium]|nr:serine/threonine protein kinase [Anaerolineae bacterium]
MPFSTGQVVHQRYRVARLLGQGGMGAVYRAWDLTLNIPVALKEMIPEPGLDYRKLGELRAQFQREAQVLAGLAHPGLPRVTDFFDWNGNAYLIMDFVEGENLSSVLLRQRQIPENQMIPWAVQLLDALAACHARNIVHRDIKPQNVVIRSDGRAVLVDFGLVKLWDPHNPQTQNIIRGVGTIEYASPEHFGLSGLHTEPRSDIYSMGAMLYHLLTGREPPSALERWSGTDILIAPRQFNTKLSPHIETAVVRAMELQPDQRFPNVQNMQAALQGRPGDTVWAGADYPQPVSSVSLQSARRTEVYAGHVSEAPSISVPRVTDWRRELSLCLLMAVVGMLALQGILFGGDLTIYTYLGLSAGALIMGGVGWFIGDLIFQALIPPSLSMPSVTSRPTQRLVTMARQVTRELKPAQLAVLLGGLVIIAGTGAWLLGPVVADIPLIWNNLPLYAVAGPLGYAATGRRRWVALASHILATGVGGVLLNVRAEFEYDILLLLLATAIGGLLIELLAVLAERFWLKS